MPAKALAPGGLPHTGGLTLALHKVQAFVVQVSVKFLGWQLQIDRLAVKRQQVGAGHAERQGQLCHGLAGGQQGTQVLAAGGSKALKCRRFRGGEAHQLALKVLAHFEHQRGCAAQRQGVGQRLEPVFMGVQRCQ